MSSFKGDLMQIKQIESSRIKMESSKQWNVEHVGQNILAFVRR